MINELRKRLKHTDDTKLLVSNIISLMVLQAATFLLPLLTMPFLVRTLGPDRFGLISFAAATINYFMLITDYGFNLSATRQVSINKENRRELISIFSSVMLIKALLMLISLMLLTFLVQTVDRFSINKEVYFVTFGMVIGQVLFPAWLFQGLEQMKFLVWLTIISKLFFTVLVFRVIKAPEDYLWVPILNGMGSLMAGLLALHILRKRFTIQFKWPALKTLKYQIFEGWHVFYSSIVISLYASSTTFILGIYSNDAAVGHYSAAERLIQAAKSIYSGFSQAMFPQISRRINANRKAGLEYVRNSALIVCTAMFLLSALLYLSSENLVKMLFGQQYQSTIFLVKIMAFTPFIVSLSNIFGVQIMLNLGYKRAFSAILTAAAVIGVVVNIALLPAYHEQGAAVCILIVESFVTIAMYLFLKLYERDYAGFHKE